MRTTTDFDVIVAGGGLIGLVTAWRAARLGLRVAVAAPHTPGEASGVAAGMLTPATEATFGEEALMRFGLLSRDRYPEFVAELRADSGHDVGYRTEGTLQVAFDTDDLARLTELMELQARLGIQTRRLTGRECRRLEPMLAPSVRGGLLAPDDHSVDPRRLTAALRAAAERHGAALVDARVEEVAVSAERVRGVLLDDGRRLEADQVVLAAGTWTSRIGGLPEGVVPPLRPVKGQLLRLRTPSGEEPIVTRTVRGLVRGTPVYLVPRVDGEVVLGATQEEMGHDTRLTVGGVWEVLRDARELVPGVTELEIAETCVGLRPGSPDNEPLLGPTRVPGLHLAVGHFRHGVLFTPATGDAMAEALTTGELPDYARRFAATRFSHASATV
ncbi:glycine oxidase [Marinactinospora thermotolerans DSM 45154]|uniref:glycine oxidase n=2 Tax=Marinactinospora thermotolerans TaxID=531310 RepID=A0A1T4MFV1_9ACTN|nr:glycine oxidase ThiO [Marinactinospora thermotolerans]SJZ65793.1 glycine oxidase [Marinactinospora thermotolerans DSM 45154]